VVESLIPLAACALYVGFFHAANTWFPALARRVRFTHDKSAGGAA
jgi:hypothetical protein